uniref:Dimer_Tnp_hAT domain-containing protein n=1 Tax=Anisakis simplex TaxID=6269 RepID=A0A0M3JPW3_ANISI
LYESKDQSHSRAINNIRQIYTSCMDQQRLAQLGGTELVKAIENYRIQRVPPRFILATVTLPYSTVTQRVFAANGALANSARREMASQRIRFDKFADLHERDQVHGDLPGYLRVPRSA